MKSCHFQENGWNLVSNKPDSERQKSYVKSRGKDMRVEARLFEIRQAIGGEGRG
jgi:hypothetical protein